MPVVTKILGFAGSASIASTQLLVTAGSFNEAVSVSYQEMISTPPSSTMAGRVLHADGTKAYNGSLSFDVNDATMALFVVTGGLLERYWEFDVGIHDGVTDKKMQKCKLTSLSISGAEGGLVNATVSFLGLTGRQAGSTPNNFIRDNAPIGYWYTGDDASVGIRDWTLTMNQSADVVYTNEDVMTPNYIKVGLVNYSLAVTTYIDLGAADQDHISISTSSFTLIGKRTGSNFNFGGLTDVGTYNYTFESSSDDGFSDTLVIS